MESNVLTGEYWFDAGAVFGGTKWFLFVHLGKSLLKERSGGGVRFPRTPGLG